MSAPPDPHKALRDDVSMLGEMLGETLRARGAPELFPTVERIRRLARDARQGDEHGAVPALEAPVRSLPLELAVPVARAFSHFLTLANIAEQHHRVRRRRARIAQIRAPPPHPVVLFGDVGQRQKMRKCARDRDRRLDGQPPQQVRQRVEVAVAAGPAALRQRAHALDDVEQRGSFPELEGFSQQPAKQSHVVA